MIPFITVSLLCPSLPFCHSCRNWVPENAGFEKNILLMLGQEYAASFDQALIDHDPAFWQAIFDRLKSRQDCS